MKLNGVGSVFLDDETERKEIPNEDIPCHLDKGTCMVILARPLPTTVLLLRANPVADCDVFSA